MVSFLQALRGLAEKHWLVNKLATQPVNVDYSFQQQKLTPFIKLSCLWPTCLETASLHLLKSCDA